jgi:hypothetical protein
MYKGKDVDTKNSPTLLRGTAKATEKTVATSGSKKRKSEIDEIFSLAAAPKQSVDAAQDNDSEQSQEKAAPLSLELQNTADKIKKAREEKLMKNVSCQASARLLL